MKKPPGAHLIADQICWTNTPEKTAILRFLVEHPLQWFSLSMLMRETGLSAPMAVEAILELIQEGVKIGQREPHEYFYEPEEISLHPDQIAARLCTRWWGKRIWVGDSLTSTIDIAKALNVQVSYHGAVILANVQTQGRGRYGNRWVSRKGKDILLTFLIEHAQWEPPPSLLSMYAATAPARVLATAYNIPISLKWPNDLMVEGKKLGGVLVEKEDVHQRLIISMGLNVHSSPDDWSESLQKTTTSLDRIQSVEWQRDLLIAQCGATWEALWETTMHDHGETIKGYWRQYSATLGKTVSLTVRGKKLVGFTKSIDDAGRLIFMDDTGTEYALLPDEVQRLRVLD